jgi:hypothetical protein
LNLVIILPHAFPVSLIRPSRRLDMLSFVSIGPFTSRTLELVLVPVSQNDELLFQLTFERVARPSVRIAQFKLFQ